MIFRFNDKYIQIVNIGNKVLTQRWRHPYEHESDGHDLLVPPVAWGRLLRRIIYIIVIVTFVNPNHRAFCRYRPPPALSSASCFWLLSPSFICSFAFLLVPLLFRGRARASNRVFLPSSRRTVRRASGRLLRVDRLEEKMARYSIWYSRVSYCTPCAWRIFYLHIPIKLFRNVEFL